MSNNTFLYIDQQTIDFNLDSIKSAITVFTPFFNRYKELNLPELTDLNFSEFFTSPKTFLVQKLTNGETLKLGSLEIDPIKAFDLFPLPESVHELIQAIENSKTSNEITGANLWGLSKILIVDNDLTINPTYIAELTDKYTYKTESADQDNALQLMTEIAENITALKVLQKKTFSNSQDWVNDLLKTDSEKKVFFPNLKVVRNF